MVDRLREVGLWDLDPLNLFRITWHNEAGPHGGGFGGSTSSSSPP
jgi:cysteine synthase